jgi:invasion protein IalB
MHSTIVARVARVAAVVGFALAVLAPAAAAQTDYPTPTTTPPTTVCANGSTNGVCNISAVVVSSGQSQNSGFLAFTGGHIALLVVIGLGTAVTGIALVRYGRRRRAGATAS